MQGFGNKELVKVIRDVSKSVETLQCNVSTKVIVRLIILS